MNKVMMAFGIFILSLTAQAQTSAQPQNPGPHVALCGLENDAEDYANFEEISAIDIKEATSLSEFHLKLVNIHLIQEQYTTVPLSFAEVKAFFSEGGEQPFNDLHIVTFRAKATGLTYIHVKSWPGDNAYGSLFVASTGELVATNTDGGISLLTAEGPFYCYKLQK